MSSLDQKLHELRTELQHMQTDLTIKLFNEEPIKHEKVVLTRIQKWEWVNVQVLR